MSPIGTTLCMLMFGHKFYTLAFSSLYISRAIAGKHGLYRP